MSRRRDQERPILAHRGPFAVECPGCREHVGVGPDLVGRVAGCPRCRCAFVVPEPDGPLVDRAIAASREPVAAFRPPARQAERLLDAERSAPTTTTSPAADESLEFSEPPLPAARIRGGQGPAAAIVAPGPRVSTWGATFVAAAGPPVQHPLVQHPPADDLAAPAPLDGTLAFRDPVKTIRSGSTEIEIRRLTPEEKRLRQSRRNLLILLVGAALLVALVVVLGSRSR